MVRRVYGVLGPVQTQEWYVIGMISFANQRCLDRRLSEMKRDVARGVDVLSLLCSFRDSELFRAVRTKQEQEIAKPVIPVTSHSCVWTDPKKRYGAAP